MSHPIVVASVALLILNDHFLKSAWPSWATGKLSDFAGLAFFPILVAALVELMTPKGRIKPKAILAMAIAFTGILFVGLQLSPIVGDAYELVLGFLQWPFRLILNPSSQMTSVVITPDPTDLVALPALLMAWRIGTRHLEQAERPREIHPASAPAT